jgi:surface polysaccharide O-acyltransferase-like enzyme
VSARTTTPRSTGSGFGRLLVAVYGVLALAAVARSAYQVTQRFAEAPLPYTLSAFAAVVYVVATIALARGTRVWRTVAWCAVGVEALGVLVVGTDSVLQPEAYPDETVWSVYGQGYGFVPLVLPFVGFWWLWRTRSGDEPGTESEAS